MSGVKFDRGVQLTEHFWSGEFQCKCGCGFGLKPSDMDPEVVEGIEAMRVALGRPIYVVRWDAIGERFDFPGSGCRCAAHNKAIGGTPGSFHQAGRAADLWGVPVDELVKAAKAVPVFAGGGIGRYPGRCFVHVDNGPRRGWRG